MPLVRLEVAASRASAMGPVTLPTLAAQNERRASDRVVSPSESRSGMGMASLWVRHALSS